MAHFLGKIFAMARTGSSPRHGISVTLNGPWSRNKAGEWKEGESRQSTEKRCAGSKMSTPRQKSGENQRHP